MASVTIKGGVKSSHTLSAAERHAAQQALLKLSSTHSSSAKALTPSALAATVAGGAHSAESTASKLIHGASADTLVGGSAVRSPASLSHSTAVSGSFGKAAQTPGHGTGPSADTINAAGHTASIVKGTDAAAKSSAKITLSDKTSVTVTGVATHNLIKPH